MSDIVIRAEGLGKQYQIGSGKPQYKTLRETISDAALSPLRRLRAVTRGKSARTNTETIWALEDVSFSVKRGEVIGIIGRNGAGKSTLLKILARITKPSTGFVEIDGRVGSLLEVGTGFHPELTGRENVYLNGAILGMRRQEIARKFDEIVAFAEIEKFIDTPVKHYSTGMGLRLGFAVAAHLEPEILIVDEVLAVGDLAFQEKCLGKMGNVAREGRTVLFVSHNLAAMQSLTEKSILLESGKNVLFTNTQAVIQEYLSNHRVIQSGSIELADWKERTGSGIARIVRLEILNEDGEHTTHTGFREPIRFRLTCVFPVQTEASFGIVIHSGTQEPLIDLRSPNSKFSSGKLTGQQVIEVNVGGLSLYPGDYLLSPWIMDRMSKVDFDFPLYCAKLTVIPSKTNQLLFLDPAWGKFIVDSEWQVVHQ